MEKIIECVPNFSASDEKTLKALTRCFEKHRVLLGYESDIDHNRAVITAAGKPQAVLKALIETVGVAVKHIDLNAHKGAHPRMGAVDVIPFVPIKNITKEEAVLISKKAAQKISQKYGIPVFLYAHSASSPNRVQLSDIRRGGFENMAAKMQSPEWKPDFGPNIPHKTAGVAACGVRDFLVAFNINLDTNDLRIAKKIASSIRESNGGIKGLKALGLELKSKNIVQVSMNITNTKSTSFFEIYQTVKKKARNFGVEIKNSELVGLAPMRILSSSIKEALKFDSFDDDKILEYLLWDRH
ncbi:MAG TPA: glutamate formimidoyltransferase [Clostridiales bacterium]|nr:glutamate formimidoyltransferase [Clostridiales bacterium]